MQRPVTPPSLGEASSQVCPSSENQAYQVAPFRPLFVRVHVHARGASALPSLRDFVAAIIQATVFSDEEEPSEAKKADANPVLAKYARYSY